MKNQFEKDTPTKDYHIAIKTPSEIRKTIAEVITSKKKARTAAIRQAIAFMYSGARSDSPYGKKIIEILETAL